MHACIKTSAGGFRQEAGALTQGNSWHLGWARSWYLDWARVSCNSPGWLNLRTMKESCCCPLLEVIVMRERDGIAEGDAIDRWERTKEREREGGRGRFFECVIVSVRMSL